MNRIGILFLMMVWPILALAQKADVYMVVNGNAVAPRADHFMTEVKPGWKIVDVKLKDKTFHYLWGHQASQTADGRQPVFDIYPPKELISYRLIRLKQKKQYRLLPKAHLTDNDYMELSLTHFSIQPIGELGFRCTPLLPLQPGEYILVDAGQDMSDMQKVTVYPFTVEARPTPSSATSSLPSPAPDGADGRSSR